MYDNDGNFNVLEGLFGLAGKAIDAKAANNAREAFDNTGPAYGVDEYGRAFLRGAPSAPGAIDPRLLIIGLVAIGLVVYLAKS